MDRTGLGPSVEQETRDRWRTTRCFECALEQLALRIYVTYRLTCRRISLAGKEPKCWAMQAVPCCVIRHCKLTIWAAIKARAGKEPANIHCQLCDEPMGEAQRSPSCFPEGSFPKSAHRANNIERFSRTCTSLPWWMGSAPCNNRRFDLRLKLWAASHHSEYWLSYPDMYASTLKFIATRCTVFFDCTDACIRTSAVSVQCCTMA